MELIKYECDILSEELGIDSKDSHTGFMQHLNILVGDAYGYSVEEVLHRPSPINFLTCAEAAVSFKEFIKNQRTGTSAYPLIPCLRDFPQELAAMLPSYGRMMDRQWLLAQMMTNFKARVGSVTKDQLKIHQQMRDVPYDQLMEAIGLCISRRSVSAPAVFAATILLDVYSILGAEAERPLEELCKYAALQKKAMHHTHLTSDVRSGPQWGPDDTNIVHALHLNVDRIEEVQKWSREGKVLLQNPVSCPPVQTATLRYSPRVAAD